MNGWIDFNSAKPSAFDLIAYYIPNGNYAWGTGNGYDTIKKEYPNVTHWKVITPAPAE